MVTLAGVALCLSWETYAEASKLSPALATLKANVALGLALGGVALWLSPREESPLWARLGTIFLGLLVAALGLATLSEDVFTVDLGIDRLLYDEVGAGLVAGAGVGNRMSPNSAFCFFSIGLALLLLDLHPRRGPWVAQSLAILVLLICLEAFVGYFYALEPLYHIGVYTQMSLISAVLFAILAMGVLLARPSSGLTEPVMKVSSAGSLARRTLLAAVVVPVAAGFLQGVGRSFGLYSGESGTAILVVAISLLLVGFVWFHARQLDRAESQAHEARREQDQLVSEARAAWVRARLSDQRLHDIVQGIEAVVWEAAAEDLGVSFVSDQAEKLLGHPIERWRREPSFWLSCVHPEDREQIASACLKAAASEAEHEVEYRAIAADGRTVWLHHTLAAVPSSSGRPRLHLRGLITNITERKQRERREACQHSVTQVLADAGTLRAAVPRIVQAVCECLDWQVGALWGVDRESEKLLCVDLWHSPAIATPEFETLSRRSTFSPGVGLPGRVWRSGEPAWIPDLALDENFPRASVAAREGLHGAFGFPIKLCGTILGVMEFFSPAIRPPDEDLLEMMGSIGNQIGQFIERKRAEEAVRESEERLRFALEAARTWTWEVHRESGQVTWSEDAPRILGFGPEAAPEDILTTLKSVHLEDRERVTAAYREALHDGKIYDVQYRIIRADGAERWLAVRGRALPGDSGQAERMLGVATDITERRDIEARLAAVALDNARLYEAERKARAEAEAANRSKDEFLAMLGHELRNPIGAISNSIRVLTHDGIDQERARSLQSVITHQSGTLSRLVDDLLDVARLTSGKIVLKREPVNVAELAKSCLASFHAAGRTSRHQVTLEADPAWVDGDPARLEQVLSNLLENAVKYTPEDGQIFVRVSAEGERTIIRVSDTGRGIEPEMMSRIFDVFTQAPQALDRSQGGLGIGLSVVKRLVELHAGEITVASAGADRGSEFTIRMPRRPPPESTRREAKPTAVRPRRILVIEDSTDAREALRAVLEMSGHTVAVAASGSEGVDKALEVRPEVAIVDIGLPGLDGYEVARKIRAADGGKDIHLIALTGYGQHEDRRRAHEADFDVHLIKPLDVAELNRILAAMDRGQAAGPRLTLAASRGARRPRPA